MFNVMYENVNDFRVFSFFTIYLTNKSLDLVISHI